ncbi:FxsA family protein [Marivita sp. GX14005]|uniref:FxsA family protein n=1 Tax=Marivita sp. GX14005 TaxID=2942276 RepID=UPI002019A79D|nr:FxsA family protein [Marivita sp. GX14005]MCL3881647.1 FxsA family protein [Marivita sp. GX14005]
MWLFAAFLLVPLIEIGLFIQVGGLIGLWPTLGIVILTAILGTWLVRSQGAMALNNLRASFSRLEDPAEPLAHGAMILLAGALLLTPGFFTDGVGFALLAPPVRQAVIGYLRKHITVQRFEMGPQTPPHRESPQRKPRDIVIEGEFHEVTDRKKPNHPGSGWTRH